MMTNCEIVAPGGNLEKLRFAVLYGAHSVYFGGEHFNLRDKSRNIDNDQIEAAITFCKQHNVKTTFLLNSFIHESDIASLAEYIKEIEHHDFDSVMVADPATLALVQKSKLNARIYLSTQNSTLNHISANFWHDAGIARVVLARETTLDDIKKIRDHSEVELEMFAHGAVCISYSGRCLLSRYLSGRDANQGACSHPCRWNFALVEEKRPGYHLEIIEHERNTQILSSKDLCMLHSLHKFKKAGVDAFKLEGRMKSLYYAANITRVYRHALDHPEQYENLKDFYTRELDLVSHRPYTDDLFNEFDDMENRDVAYVKKTQFLGYVSKSQESKEVTVKALNPIRPGEKIEAILPITHGELKNIELTVEAIFDPEKGNEEELARPNRESLIHFNCEVPNGAVLRKELTTT